MDLRRNKGMKVKEDGGANEDEEGDETRRGTGGDATRRANVV
jgi:hypothetical protein